MEKFARREWRFEICVLKSHPLSLTLMGFPFTNKPPVGMSKMLSSQLRDHIFWVTKAFKQSALAEGSLTTNVCTNRKPCINVHILPVGSGWYASIAMKRNYPSGSEKRKKKKEEEGISIRGGARGWLLGLKPRISRQKPRIFLSFKKSWQPWEYAPCKLH